MQKIMDVSRHQGPINWAKVKSSGLISGVMLRAMGNSAEGEPSAPYIDPQFARNYSECTRLGISCGVYGYFKAANREEADKELSMFRQAIGGRTIQLPVAVDIEDKVQMAISQEQLTDIASYCLAAVESWGVYAMLYTGLWFGNTYLHMGGAALKAYDVWLAAYRSKKPTTDFAYGMWQYTSSGRIPGVVDATPGKITNVDLSVAYKDYEKIIQKKGLTRLREDA